MTGYFIAEQRKKKNLTQQQLADIIHVSNKTISKWENNRGLPDISLIIPLSNALDVNPLEILKGNMQDNEKLSINDVIDYNNIALKMKKQYFKKNLLYIGLTLIIIWLGLLIANFIRVYNFNLEPLFIVNTKEEFIKDGPSNYLNKQYSGLGYSWDLKGSLSDYTGNSIITNKDSNYHFTIDEGSFKIFNIELFSFVRGVNEVNFIYNITIFGFIKSTIFLILYCFIIYIVLNNIRNYKNLIFIYLSSFGLILILFYINGFYIFDQLPSRLITFRLILYPIILTIIDFLIYKLAIKIHNKRSSVSKP